MCIYTRLDTSWTSIKSQLSTQRWVPDLTQMIWMLRMTPHTTVETRILHHLLSMEPYEKWYILQINWCRIPSINSMNGQLLFGVNILWGSYLSGFDKLTGQENDQWMYGFHIIGYEKHDCPYPFSRIHLWYKLPSFTAIPNCRYTTCQVNGPTFHVMVYHGPLQIATELGSGAAAIDPFKCTIHRYESIYVPCLINSPSSSGTFKPDRDHSHATQAMQYQKGNPSKLPYISYVCIKFDPQKKTSPVTIPWKMTMNNWCFCHNVDAWRMTSYPTGWCWQLGGWHRC